MNESYSSDWLLRRWETMVRIRRSEELIAGMVESGEVTCPCHLCIGQEAIAAGVCAALRREDSVWGGHRSHGHYLAKGGSIEALFAEVLGKATGCSGGRGGSMHLLAVEAGIFGTAPIVAATVPLAVGAAFAYRMKGQAPSAGGGHRVAVSFFGDGAMEEGHVHESMNLAALYRLPVIFVCENNLYSSHMHWGDRRIADNLDQAGTFHSIPGERVDGNDVSLVYEAARAAVEKARLGLGPSFIECRTFRWRGHVGASYDLDVGVKRHGELSEWIGKDPVQRVASALGRCGVNDLDKRRTQIENDVIRALDAARVGPSPAPDRVTEHVWREEACVR